jgi:hypothetical protein
VEQSAPLDAITVTPVVRTGLQQPAKEVGMIEVAVAAFGLTGVIMSAAIIAGFLAGAAYVWYRTRHAVTVIEARGNNPNFLRE